MAMLLLRDVFARTWGASVGPPPEVEPWAEILAETRRRVPDLLLLAEAYWDTEWTLQQLGFDYCYDKRLHDRLLNRDASGLRKHIQAPLEFQSRLVRFVENHDEDRVAARLDARWQRLAAVTATSLPGARLLHEGQPDGARIRLPVQLGRRPDEPASPALRAFYDALLAEVHHDVFHDGQWQLCAAPEPLLAWCWRLEDHRRLVVINPSDATAQGRVVVPWPDLAGPVLLADPLDGARFVRAGGEMRTGGLYVALPAAGVHFFQVLPASR